MAHRIIRRYQDGDTAGVVDVWRRASEIAHHFLPGEFLDREERNIVERWLPASETWLAVVDDGIVGYLALVGNEVGAIFVDPNRQGEGHGRALMDHARSMHDRLVLDVFEQNAVGRRFYDRYGFVAVGTSIFEETGHRMMRMEFDDRERSKLPYRLTSRRRAGHTFDVTMAGGATFGVKAGGSPELPGPMELMLTSLATCAQSTILDVFDKMRRPVDDVRVDVAAERADGVPHVWTRVVVQYLVRGDVPWDRAMRAVEVTERTCSAAAMMAKATELSEELVLVHPVDAASTRPLRQRVLRPHQTLDELATHEEDGPDAAWFAASHHDEILGVTGVKRVEPGVWRLVGAAVADHARDRGIGSMLMDGAVEHIRNEGGGDLWCSSRTAAVSFYERAGFKTVGDVYDEPHTGPHIRMERSVHPHP